MRSLVPVLVSLAACGPAAEPCDEPVRCDCGGGREGVAFCEAGRRGPCVCDTGAAPGEPWLETFGDALPNGPVSVAAAPGGLVIAGAFEGRLTLGGLPLDSAGGTDAFLAAFDATGAHRWSRRYGGAGDDALLDVTVDGDGTIHASGYFSGAIAIGEHEAVARGMTDAMVAAWEGDGRPRWLRTYGGERFERLSALATTPSGDVVAAGSYQDEIERSGQTLIPVGGTDLLIVAVSASGQERWLRSFGGSGDDQALALDASDDTLVGGRIGRTLEGDKGEPALGEDAFVLALDEAGHDAGFETYGGTGRDRLSGLGVDDAGRMYLGGHFRGELGLGPDREVQLTAAGGTDAFVAVLDDAGAVLAARAFGDAADERLWSLDVAPEGGVLIGGSFSGTVDFGDGLRQGAGAAFAAQLDESLELVAALHGGEEAAIRDVALGAGRWLVAGRFAGRIELAGRKRRAIGGGDLFFAAIEPP